MKQDIREAIGSGHVEYRSVAAATRDPDLLLRAHRTPCTPFEAERLIAALTPDGYPIPVVRFHNSDRVYYLPGLPGIPGRIASEREPTVALPRVKARPSRAVRWTPGLNVARVLHELAHHLHCCADPRVAAADDRASRRRIWHGPEFTAVLDGLLMDWTAYEEVGR